MREHGRQKRKSLTIQERESREKKIFENFLFLSKNIFYNNIAVYFAVDGEVNLNSIINYCFKKNKKIFVPVLDNINNNLIFKEYKMGEKCIKNKFNIPEPVNNFIITPENLDLVLVPLTVFDAHKNRMGMGMGFYDKCFEYKKNNNQSKPYLMGVGYNFQYVNKINIKSHDIKMDGILTDDYSGLPF